jgi:hypothetical protein
VHPALIIAVMEEHEREMARRTRHAWRHPETRSARTAPHRPRRVRLSAALARVSAFFG